ncbi:programmed cell death protein 2-like [Athalia rosae]|uniref:programmed cell death protein 2-like n=1 Tax=Athalia rosae TaxID=37344 RepID=UPI002033E0B3|nr:programmed cell death protein 2-like [Athalia rosae]XP_048512912.1 programmed cell death protein 2-like [Athalia rosae]XP_048512913.1 programmed cell death protein 2-like [Athalia rosae]XP_048512914.1 programmed cell death protein 2-like [Athalia rosae]
MARNTNCGKVYLGYEDECVTEKHRSLVNFTTNKIGGKPDWHCGKTSIKTPQCTLCGLQQLLALQIYAPLDNSKYHRTLYIFTCINPNCWNQNESWTCIRVQSVEDMSDVNTSASSSVHTESLTSWLTNADDWGNDSNDNTSEQNGNNVAFSQRQFSLSSWNESLDHDFNNDFTKLHVDDPNANSPTGIESPTVGGGGAVGRLDSPHASAEIEGEENEVICIDSPTKPQHDLVTLLHEVTPLPIQHVESKDAVCLSFTEIFISVDEEDCTNYVTQHVRDLLLEYQQCNPDSIPNSPVDSGASKQTDTTLEKYEKGIPVHGDEMFHDFMSRLQMNPGQILRYSRDGNAALLPYPIGGTVGRCKHCGEQMTFELQILPTIIPKLKLNTQQEQDFQIEFGTVLIHTCSRSCWSSTDTYREEPVIVQAEKLF